MLTSIQIANFTGIPDRTIRDWQQLKKIPESADMSVVVKGMIEYLQRKQEKANKEADEEELLRQKCRLTEAQAYKVELENAEKEGESVNAKAITMAGMTYIHACKAKLLPMGTVLSPKLARIEDANQIKEIIDSVIDEALHELGSGDFVRALGSDSENGDRVQAAAAIDGERMG